MALPMVFFSLDNNDRLTIPSKYFIGISLGSATSMQVGFVEEDGSADSVRVYLDFLPGKVKEASEVLAGALAGQSRGLTVVADAVTGEYLYPFTGITNIT